MANKRATLTKDDLKTSTKTRPKQSKSTEEFTRKTSEKPKASLPNAPSTTQPKSETPAPVTTVTPPVKQSRFQPGNNRTGAALSILILLTLSTYLSGRLSATSAVYIGIVAVITAIFPLLGLAFGGTLILGLLLKDYSTISNNTSKLTSSIVNSKGLSSTGGLTGTSSITPSLTYTTTPSPSPVNINQPGVISTV